MTTPGLSAGELRVTVVHALERAVDLLEGGHASLLRTQLRRTETDATAYGPASFCLGLGHLISGSEDTTLPVATAMGLLEEMARVFVDLEADPPEPLAASWGMPRALNSGDAFYAAAQRVILDHEGFTAEQRLEMLGVLTAAARAFSESLHAWAPNGREGVGKAVRSLYPAAASMAALASEAGEETAARLAAIAADLASQPEATLDGALRKAAALNLRRS
jgi:hypothetical protein